MSAKQTASNATLWFSVINLIMLLIVSIGFYLLYSSLADESSVTAFTTLSGIVWTANNSDPANAPKLTAADTDVGAEQVDFVYVLPTTGLDRLEAKAPINVTLFGRRTLPGTPELEFSPIVTNLSGATQSFLNVPHASGDTYEYKVGYTSADRVYPIFSSTKTIAIA